MFENFINRFNDKVEGIVLKASGYNKARLEEIKPLLHAEFSKVTREDIRPLVDDAALVLWIMIKKGIATEAEVDQVFEDLVELNYLGFQHYVGTGNKAEYEAFLAKFLPDNMKS